MLSEIDKLVHKIVKGKPVNSKEDLQLYVNNTEEIEERLKKYQERLERSHNGIGAGC